MSATSRILVVDDVEWVVRDIVEFVDGLELDLLVDEAGNVSEALGLIAQHDYLLAILDIVMPAGPGRSSLINLGGFEIADELCRKGKTPSIIFVSGMLGLTASLPRCPQVLVHFMQKPVRRAQLQSAVLSSLKSGLAGSRHLPGSLPRDDRSC